MSSMILMVDTVTGDIFPAWRVCEDHYGRVLPKEKSGQYKPLATSKLEKIEERQGCEIFKVIGSEEAEGLPEPELIKNLQDYYHKKTINLEVVNRELEKFYENVQNADGVCEISESVERVDQR